MDAARNGVVGDASLIPEIGWPVRASTSRAVSRNAGAAEVDAHAARIAVAKASGKGVIMSLSLREGLHRFDRRRAPFERNHGEPHRGLALRHEESRLDAPFGASSKLSQQKHHEARAFAARRLRRTRALLRLVGGRRDRGRGRGEGAAAEGSLEPEPRRRTNRRRAGLSCSRGKGAAVTTRWQSIESTVSVAVRGDFAMHAQ